MKDTPHDLFIKITGNSSYLQLFRYEFSQRENSSPKGPEWLDISPVIINIEFHILEVDTWTQTPISVDIGTFAISLWTYVLVNPYKTGTND